jgi:glycerol-3-phosphate O-acyltransferase
VSDQPWPATSANSGDNVLFILDASHRVEEQLLRDWLEKCNTENGFTGQYSQVVVRIALNPEAIPAQPLVQALDVAADTLIIPLRVVWRSSIYEKNTSPRWRDLLWDNIRRPGVSRASRMLKKDPNRAQCIVAKPATLEELQQRHTARRGERADSLQLAEYVAGQAGLALDVAERRLRGSRYKVPRRVAKNLQASPRFKAALEEISAETGRDLPDLQAESAKIMKELISTPTTFWLDVMAAVDRKILSLGYANNVVVDQEGLDKVRELTRQHPSALLWSHKTYIDGFVSQYIFFKNDFPATHTLGGVNMAFAGLGFLARRAGAIFIRRSFKDNLLYKMILRQYIGYLLEKRFPFSWSFEGTRSRVGKLMPPRYGLLKYVTEAAYDADARNLHVFPISISYDLIGDVVDMTKEQVSTVKSPESLRWFMGYLRGLRKPMGRVYLDFGNPVVLEQAPSGKDPLELQKIAFQIGVETNRVTPITLASLATMILLGTAPRAITQDEFIAEINAFVTWARARDIRLTSDFDTENREQMLQLSEVLVKSGLVTRYDGGSEIVYTIAAENHAEANYYRNTTIHHFVNKAIAELALLHVVEITDNTLDAFWTEAERLRDLFKFEFFYAPTDEFREQLDTELSRYRPDWQERLAASSNTAQSLLLIFQPLVAHTALLSFTEAYRIVAMVLAETADDEALEEKYCISTCLAYGRQAYLQRRISSEASIGKLLFENGYKLMENMGLTQAGDAELGKRRKEMSQSLRELAHRIDIIRSIAIPR